MGKRIAVYGLAGILLSLVIAMFVVAVVQRKGDETAQNTAVLASLKEIYSGEHAYSNAFNQGYAPTLATLKESGFIGDEALTPSGYVITYQPSGKEHIRSYTLRSEPITFKRGLNYYFMNDRGYKSARAPIVFGDVIHKNLSRDWQFYADYYVFKGTAGQRIVINLDSSEFETKVYLENLSGLQVDSNDDYMTAINHSRIPPSGAFILPATDTYYIDATSNSGKEPGIYTLRLSLSE